MTGAMQFMVMCEREGDDDKENVNVARSLMLEQDR